MDSIQFILLSYGTKIVLSIAVLVIGRWIASKLSIFSKKIMDKYKVDETLSKFLSNLIYGLLIIFIILAALSNLGIETTSFVAMLGAMGLAIGMAFKDNFSNLGAGVLIVIFKPFRVGDYVDAAGVLGIIEEVNLFSTFMLTTDNKQVIVPNSNILGSNIINYTKKLTRRVDLTFGIGYGDDLKKAKQILRDIANSNEKVLKDPVPFVAVSELADSSVNLVLRQWVKREDYWSVYFDTIERVKLSFDEQGISIPFPQLDIHNNK